MRGPTCGRPERHLRSSAPEACTARALGSSPPITAPAATPRTISPRVTIAVLSDSEPPDILGRSQRSVQSHVEAPPTQVIQAIYVVAVDLNQRRLRGIYDRCGNRQPVSHVEVCGDIKLRVSFYVDAISEVSRRIRLPLATIVVVCVYADSSVVVVQPRIVCIVRNSRDRHRRLVRAQHDISGPDVCIVRLCAKRAQKSRQKVERLL